MTVKEMKAMFDKLNETEPDAEVRMAFSKPKNMVERRPITGHQIVDTQHDGRVVWLRDAHRDFG